MPVRFSTSLVLWLEFSCMTTFPPCHIYFALRRSSKTLQSVFLTPTQNLGYFFSLNIGNINVFPHFSLPLLESHPSPAQAHNWIVFCCLIPVLHVLQIFKIFCFLLDFWEVSYKSQWLDVCINHPSRSREKWLSQISEKSEPKPMNPLTTSSTFWKLVACIEDG